MTLMIKVVATSEAGRCEAFAVVRWRSGVVVYRLLPCRRREATVYRSAAVYVDSCADADLPRRAGWPSACFLSISRVEEVITKDTKKGVTKLGEGRVDS